MWKRFVNWINKKKIQSFISLISIIIALVAFLDAKMTSRKTAILSQKADSLEITLNDRILRQIQLFQRSADSISILQLSEMKDGFETQKKTILANIVIPSNDFKIIPISFDKYSLRFIAEVKNIGKRDAKDVSFSCFLVNNDISKSKVNEIKYNRIEPEIVKNHEFNFDIDGYSLDKFYFIINIKYLSVDGGGIIENKWIYFETQGTEVVELKSKSRKELREIIENK